MRAVALWCLALVVLSSAAIFADDYVVLMDDEVDFSILRTFTVRDVNLTSTHPALGSPILRSQLRDATQVALAGRGLTAASNQPALIVDCSVRGVEFAVDRTGRPVEQRSGRGGRRGQPSTNPRDFTEGTLVIDVTRADTRELIWRGVYHDTEQDPSRIVAAPPGARRETPLPVSEAEEAVISRLLVLLGMLLGLTGVLLADESSVQVDPTTDFSVLRTFSFRVQQVQSRREELDNPLFLKKLAAAIRRGLIAKGLTETRDRPDLLVDFTITGEDFGDAERYMVRGIRGGPVAIRRPIRIAEGTLVIDVFKRDDADPIWRGVYRDDERTGSKLPHKLPQDATQLIAKYPKIGK